MPDCIIRHIVPKFHYINSSTLVLSPDIGLLNCRLQLLSAMCSLGELKVSRSSKGIAELILSIAQDSNLHYPGLVFACYVYEVAGTKAYYCFLCEVYPSGNSITQINPYTLSEDDFVCRFVLEDSQINIHQIIHLEFTWQGELISTNPRLSYTFQEISGFYFTRQEIASPNSEEYISESQSLFLN